MPRDFDDGIDKSCSISLKPYSLRDVVGFDGDMIFDESKPDGTPRKLLDISKIRKMGWTPKISFEKGIKLTYEWYKEHKGGILENQT